MVKRRGLGGLIAAAGILAACLSGHSVSAAALSGNVTAEETAVISEAADVASVETESIPDAVAEEEQQEEVSVSETEEEQESPVSVIPMYRMYNPNTGEHFYTRSEQERETIYAVGWEYEGVGFYTPETSNTPIYRLFNPNEDDHHYTGSAKERDILVSIGWRYEGIAWYSDDSHTLPAYRLFNPNARCGSHHYTLNTAERDKLVSIGWQYEGIAFYASKSGSQYGPTRYRGIELRDIYDYDDYLKYNPDVKELYGGDRNKTLDHFARVGINEGRTAKESYDTARYQELKDQLYQLLHKKIVCIDAGHQRHGMSAKEPNAPGSSVMKAKVTSGAYGNWSKKNEYEVNLEVSLKLKQELVKRGYQVVMTRESHDVTLSNIDRAQIANNAGADILVRVHCNDVDSSSVTGVLAYVPSAGNRYLGTKTAGRSRTLGQALVDGQCAATGQRNRGLLDGDDMTGINWAKMPVAIIEMGFMSNPSEDRSLGNDAYQNRIVQGLANGIDNYFTKIES